MYSAISGDISIANDNGSTQAKLSQLFHIVVFYRPPSPYFKFHCDLLRR